MFDGSRSMILHVGKYHPFTVDDFPMVSTDEQQDALYTNPEISLRGPKILWNSMEVTSIQARNWQASM